MDLMSIGEFARLPRLSAKALRLYDELGLLQLAASFPGLTLRTEPAHQEAYIHLGHDPVTAAQSQLDSAMGAWAAEQQRQHSDLPLRVTLLATIAPVTDASRRGGSDFALPLRGRAGAA